MSSATLTVHVRTRIPRLARLRVVAHTLWTGHWSWTLKSPKRIQHDGIWCVCNACGKRVKVGVVTVTSEGKR